MINKLIGVALAALLLSPGIQAQERRIAINRGPLPPLTVGIRSAQQEIFALYRQHTPDQDVNSIVKDIEQYLDSLPKNKSQSDVLLSKQFMPMRHFFLTTANNTTVAAGFLYKDAPYRFCTLGGDTANVLYLYAVKNGDSYNRAKTTERRVARKALDNCLLPTLKALDEFKPGSDIRYVALSMYYTCKDTREGADPNWGTVYFMTIVARMDVLQQYATGIITAKGLVSSSDLYLSSSETPEEVTKVNIPLD